MRHQNSVKLTKQRILETIGISRQAHHKNMCRNDKQQQQNKVVLEKVRAIRRKHPRMGTVKLHKEIMPDLATQGIFLGRDRFFDLLRQENMLVPTKRRQTRTTHSGLWRFPNLLKEQELSAVNQAWVGDITYLTLEKDYAYLVLLTDAYSRFIVGYDLSKSLEASGAERALRMGIQQTEKEMLVGCLHHTDHGRQYASYRMLNKLKEYQMQPSMGEVGNCYENALAERMNGILKLEYGLDAIFVNFEQAQLAVRQAVWLYNFERPHMSLDYRKPAEVHFDGK